MIATKLRVALIIAFRFETCFMGVNLAEVIASLKLFVIGSSWLEVDWILFAVPSLRLSDCRKIAVGVPDRNVDVIRCLIK